MECPKCGFQQPQEAYCARCGVSIRKATMARQWRIILVIFLTMAAMTLGGLALVPRFQPGRTNEKDGPGGRMVPETGQKGEPAPRAPSPSQKKALEMPAKAAPRPAAVEQRRETSAAQSASVPARAQPTGEAQAPKTKTGGDQPPAESGSAEVDPEGQIRRWAAQEWFQKGLALDNGSEEELALYEKSIEVDPHYAPAHYQMGMILWGWGNRDEALEAFQLFLQYATQEERALYPLPESVNVEDLGGVPEEQAPALR